MPGSKPGALPLGDTPILLNVYPSPKSHVYRQLIELNHTEAHFTLQSVQTAPLSERVLSGSGHYLSNLLLRLPGKFTHKQGRLNIATAQI